MAFKPLPIGIDDFEDTGDTEQNTQNKSLFEDRRIMAAGEH